MIDILTLHWHSKRLTHAASEWYQDMHQHYQTVSEWSAWWGFMSEKQISHWLIIFRMGLHGFSPLTRYRFCDGTVCVWSYLDRLMIHLLMNILRPTFKHIISPVCLHLKGPSVVKGITKEIKAALETGQFHYVLRLDMRSYYASIDHRILVKQVNETFDDPLIQQYLEAIITVGIDCDGIIKLPTKGIPRGGALSPFFGALYLKPLDEAFENRENCLFLRYMDDVLILVKTQRQYQRAKKQIFKILRELRLKLSPHKTWMGKLEREFHFLGVSFDPTRIGQSKENQTPLVSLHSRSYQRALDKLKAMREDAVHPAKMQSYLSRWALWWYSATGTSYQALINRWRNYTEDIQANLCWIGSGLLLGTSFDRLNRCFNNTSCLKTVV